MQMGHATSRIRLPDDPSEDLEPAKEPTHLFINRIVNNEEDTCEMEQAYEDTNLMMISCLYPWLPVSDQRLCYVLCQHVYFKSSQVIQCVVQMLQTILAG